MVGSLDGFARWPQEFSPFLERKSDLRRRVDSGRSCPSNSRAHSRCLTFWRCPVVMVPQLRYDHTKAFLRRCFDNT